MPRLVLLLFCLVCGAFSSGKARCSHVCCVSFHVINSCSIDLRHYVSSVLDCCCIFHPQRDSPARDRPVSASDTYVDETRVLN